MKRKVVLLFSLALSVRLLYILCVYLIHPEGVFVFDSWGYLNLGYNLSEFQVFSQYTDGSLIPDSTRTPVYPLFLSLFYLFGLNEWWILISQAALSSLTVALLFKLSQKVGLTKKVGFIACLLLVFDPVSIYFSSVIMSESLFCFLLIAVLLSFIQKKYWLSGILLGLSILCKPIAFLMPIVFLVYTIWTDKISAKLQFKQLVVFSTPIILLCGLWMQRNKLVFDQYFLSSITEVNLLFHSATNIKAKANSQSAKEVELNYRNKLLGDLDWNSTESIAVFRQRSREEFLNQISQHPKEFISIYSRSFLLFFIKPMRSYFDQQFGLGQGKSISGVMDELPSPQRVFKESSLLGLSMSILQIISLILIFIAAIGLRKGTVLDKKQMLLLLSFIMYFALLSSISEVDARFRLPVFPIILILGFSSQQLQKRLG